MSNGELIPVSDIDILTFKIGNALKRPHREQLQKAKDEYASLFKEVYGDTGHIIDSLVLMSKEVPMVIFCRVWLTRDALGKVKFSEREKTSAKL